VDEQGERPDHGDEDDVLVGIVQEKRRREEETGGRDSKKNKEGEPLFHPLREIVILLLFHIYDYKLNFYKKEPKNIKKSEF
jgi:hypothetical protein